MSASLPTFPLYDGLYKSPESGESPLVGISAETSISVHKISSEWTSRILQLISESEFDKLEKVKHLGNKFLELMSIHNQEEARLQEQEVANQRERDKFKAQFYTKVKEIMLELAGSTSEIKKTNSTFMEERSSDGSVTQAEEMSVERRDVREGGDVTCGGGAQSQNIEFVKPKIEEREIQEGELEEGEIVEDDPIPNKPSYSSNGFNPKRKPLSQLSNNPITPKNGSEHDQDPRKSRIHTAKSNDRNAVNSAKRKKRKEEVFRNASEEQRSKMLEEVEESVMLKRRRKGTDWESLAARNRWNVDGF